MYRFNNYPPAPGDVVADGPLFDQYVGAIGSETAGVTLAALVLTGVRGNVSAADAICQRFVEDMPSDVFCSRYEFIRGVKVVLTNWSS
ncbi:MAG TPA: hypothetical protein VFB59_00595 [Candidatus Saccharimonadales bacterium]|nr:hypothetical protein [Candidatus Saccharimonadales bacterium]